MTPKSFSRRKWPGTSPGYSDPPHSTRQVARSDLRHQRRIAASRRRVGAACIFKHQPFARITPTHFRNMQGNDLAACHVGLHLFRSITSFSLSMMTTNVTHTAFSQFDGSLSSSRNQSKVAWDESLNPEFQPLLGRKLLKSGPVSSVEMTARTISEAKANSESMPCSCRIVAATISISPLHCNKAPRLSV